MSFSSPMSPSFRRRRRSLLRQLERICCNALTYLPLIIVYGLTTWAVWVEVHLGLRPETRFGSFYVSFGVALYALLNWSYTTAVFTDPGSPTATEAYGGDLQLASVTVKSTGEMRYCKKCRSRKPDRAHHCSACERCVLKMDHHCPWLATCVGFRNYKPFLLFLIYTSLFGWLCFFATAYWLYYEVVTDGKMDESSLPIHFVILAVVSGIISLVISGFTAYHLYLTSKNRTTLENLEKTRYLSPLRSRVDQRLHEPRTYMDDQNHSIGEQLRDLGTTLTEIHVNALPGVLRPEEGEERPSPAHNSLRRHMQSNMTREQQQYNDYLDERDNERLPNAFDLGWRRNMLAVFGREPWLWWLPVCNSIGNGWHWEQSDEWKRQRELLSREREAEAWRYSHNDGAVNDSAVSIFNHDGQNGAPRMGGQFSSTSIISRQGEARDVEDSSDDGSDDDGRRRLLSSNARFDPHPGSRVVGTWNDVPDEMLSGPGRGVKKS